MLGIGPFSCGITFTLCCPHKAEGTRPSGHLGIGGRLQVGWGPRIVAALFGGHPDCGLVHFFLRVLSSSCSHFVLPARGERHTAFGPPVLPCGEGTWPQYTSPVGTYGWSLPLGFATLRLSAEFSSCLISRVSSILWDL